MTKRCFNCHGGMSPFIGVLEDGKFTPLTPRGTHPTLDKTDGVIVADNNQENVAKTFQGCITCHDAGRFSAGGWRLAPTDPETRFTIVNSGIPKSTIDICKQVKVSGTVPGAAGFIGHMTNDNGKLPFLETAFAGDMALNKDEKDAAGDDLKNEGGYPAPITVMTREEALQFSKDWVADMGGKFRLPDDCGCKEHHYALRVLAHGVLQMPGFTFTLRFDGIGTTFPEVPLKFEDDGTFSGEVMATPMTDNQGGLPLVSCSGERSNQVKVVVKGSWEDIDATSQEPTNEPPSPPQHPIRVNITFSQVQTNASETCSTPLGMMSGSSNQTGAPQFTFDIVFPDPHVDQAEAVDWPAPFPGWSGAVRAQIIDGGGSKP